MSERTVSPDGLWEWDGQAWRPTAAPVQSENDPWWWDGVKWVPTSRGVVSRRQAAHADRDIGWAIPLWLGALVLSPIAFLILVFLAAAIFHR